MSKRRTLEYVVILKNLNKSYLDEVWIPRDGFCRTDGRSEGNSCLVFLLNNSALINNNDRWESFSENCLFLSLYITDQYLPNIPGKKRKISKCIHCILFKPSTSKANFL